MAIRLADIVERFGGELRGDGNILIERVATLETAREGEISFLSNPKYTGQLASTRAAAVILSPRAAAGVAAAAILTDEPYLYFARLAQWLTPKPNAAVGAHPSAVVEIELPPGVSVGACAYVGPGAVIGEGTIIGPNCTIGRDVRIGADSLLHANVTVYDGCRIGARALLHSGAVIGSDGFGFAREKTGAWVKIPQTGIVIIGDDVEIGAGTTIDRGALADTVIEDGVKLDNQIQIAHNVRIGAHTAMAGCVGVAGSTTIGRRCTVGGGAIILGHLKIADDVNVSAGTLVAKSIAQAGTYSAMVPFMEHTAWLKNFAHLRHLDAMADKIRALESRLGELENKK